MRRSEPLRMKSRTGWTLIEMSIVISLLGMFTVVATSILTTLMDLETSIATTSAFEMSAQRLEDQLRVDAETSLQVKQFEDGFDLIPEQGAPIQFRVQDGQVVRTVEGERHRSLESFPFVNSKIELHSESNTISVTVINDHEAAGLSRSTLLETPVGELIHFDVVIGRALRFRGNQETGEDDS